MRNRYTLSILIFYLFFIILSSCEDLQAHRLLQYKSGTVVYGSKKAYVNLVATTLISTKIKSSALIIPIETSSISQFEDV